MIVTFLILCFGVLGQKCETEGGKSGTPHNGTFSSGENETSTGGVSLLPKQEALTFLRPTVVRSPPGISFPPSRSRDEIPARRMPAAASDYGGLDSSPGIRNPLFPKRKIQNPPFLRDRVFDPQIGREGSFLLRHNPRPPSIPFLRKGPSRDTRLRTRANPVERSRSPPIDRMDSFVDFDDFGDMISERPPVSYREKSSNTFPSKPDTLQGSLDAALKSLWLYRKKAYETLLARSVAMEKYLMKNMKNAKYGGQWSPTREPSKTNMNRDFSSDFTHQNAPTDIKDHIDARNAFPSEMSYYSPTPENRQGYREDSPSLVKDMSSLTYSVHRPEQYRPFRPPRRFPSFDQDSSKIGNIFSRVRNFFQGDQRKREEYPSLSRRGSRRTPRMQLVKRSNRPLSDIIDEYEIYTDDNINNTFNEDETHITTNDTQILTMDYVNGGEDNSSRDGVYVYYVDEEDRNVVGASDRMDIVDDFYYLEDLEGLEDPENIEYIEYLEGEEGNTFIDGEYFGPEDEYVEVEYVDEEYEYNHDEDEEGSGYFHPSLDISRMGTINDSEKLNRQGLLNLGIFKGKKRPTRKRKIKKRPYSRPSGTYRPSLPPPRSPTVSHSEVPRPGVKGPTFTIVSPPGKKKNIRLKIRSKKKPGAKRIRMKIKGIPRSGSISIKGSRYEEEENAGYSSSSYTHYDNETKPHSAKRPDEVSKPLQNSSYESRPSKTKDGQRVYSSGFRVIRPSTHLSTRSPTDQKKKIPGGQRTKISGYGGIKPTSYGGTKASSYGGIKASNNGGIKTSSYEGIKTSSYGGIKTSSYGGIKNMGYGGAANFAKGGKKGIKGSLGWANLKQMSESLPDLNKAITVMSFIAFSIFVANLGINAIANTTQGISFGRSGTEWSDWFRGKPNFSLDGMIHDLDRLFETVDTQSNSSKPTINTIVDLVQGVYNDLHETTKTQMENARQKITNFLRNDFSENNLLVGDISKGFLSRKLDTGVPYEQLEDTCYRKLLCLSHNLTRKHIRGDMRNKLLPFWTFGVGWLTSGESRMSTLLENLRAELAGLSGRDCQKLFASCANNTAVESLLTEVKEELLRSPLLSSKDTQVLKWKRVSVSRPKIEITGKESTPFYKKTSFYHATDKEKTADRMIPSISISAKARVTKLD